MSARDEIMTLMETALQVSTTATHGIRELAPEATEGGSADRPDATMKRPQSVRNEPSIVVDGIKFFLAGDVREIEDETAR
jgi:hypothetical protein